MSRFWVGIDVSKRKLDAYLKNPEEIGVWAQSAADKAAAEGLFDQGRASMQEGDFAKACGLLERSQHIDPGVGTLLYLAECYEKSGRTASARSSARPGPS